MTDAPATVYERMVAILAELPPIGKNRRNQQQGFMFRGHDDVLNAPNPLLAKHGVFVLPRTLERLDSQRATRNGGVMWTVHLHVEFRFYGAGGDYVECSTWGEGTDSGDKATSKAHTMAFKYALFEVFAISSEEASDPDGHHVEESTTASSQPFAATGQGGVRGTGTITEPQQKRLFAIAREKNVDPEKVKELVRSVAGVASSADVPKGKYDELVAAVEAVV